MNTRHDRYAASAPAADGPTIGAEAILGMVERELSPRRRIWNALLLLVALSVAVVVGALLLTEPSLPMRTQVAFAVIVIAALAWCVGFGRALLRPGTLYVQHRLLTATLALSVTAVFTLGAALLAWLDAEVSRTATYAALAMLPFLATAMVLWLRARRDWRALRARRHALARAQGS